VELDNLGAMTLQADSFYFLVLGFYREIKRRGYVLLQAKNIIENTEEYPECLNSILFDQDEVSPHYNPFLVL
jgi:hypothetical protein